MPLDPIRDGYQFSGWCVNANCTVLFDFDTVIVENMTLYAKWDKIAAEGGSGSFSYSWLVLLLIAVFVIIAIFKDVSK